MLDLRNNPGGLLDQAVRVADAFIDSGLIVHAKAAVVSWKKSARIYAVPARASIICMVNGGFGFSGRGMRGRGAVQNHGRAVVMGTQTFGKGSVQTIIDWKMAARSS